MVEMENPHELTTKVTAVTLYRDGARIERTGAITLSPGTQKIRIPNLTRYLDKESVRVSGHGYASIVSFDTVDTTVQVSGYEKLDTLAKRKEDLEKQKSQVQRELTRLSARSNFFAQVLDKSAAEFSRWIPAGECEVDRVTILESQVTTQLDQLDKTQTKVQEKLENLDKELAMVNREIDKLRREAQQYEVTNTIVVNVEAHKAGKCEFRITYFVAGAAWAPTYDFDLAEDKATVTMFTVVRNNTREDWQSVQVAVSTATNRPATLVEPSPYLLHEYVPPPPVAMKARTMRPATASGYARDEAVTQEAMLEEKEMAPPPPAMGESEATVQEVGGVLVFVLPEPVSVPADGEPHAFRTKSVELSADRKFFWNAVDFAEVIEVTTIENGDTVLLPGKARIYSSEEYLGETVLKLVAPNEKVDLGTRFTYDLKGEKKLVAKGAEKTGLTRGNVAREYAYELTIKNFRKKPSPIKVMDRIPHSDSEKIKVENRRFSPKPTEDKLSVLTWELEVPASEETKITYSFQIDYPRGTIITPPLP
jgi:uncharacterized protein (TIGR02231 family)